MGKLGHQERPLWGLSKGPGKGDLKMPGEEHSRLGTARKGLEAKKGTRKCK